MNEKSKEINERTIEEQRRENDLLRQKMLAHLEVSNQNQSTPIENEINNEKVEEDEQSDENDIVDGTNISSTANNKDCGKEENGEPISETKFYQRALQSLEKLHSEYIEQKQNGETKINSLQQKLEEKKKTVVDIRESLYKFKRDIASKAVCMKTGKPISMKTIDELLNKEKLKQNELEQERMKTIQSKIEVKKMERKLLFHKNELSEHLDLLFDGYEQVQSENSNLKKKNDEREKELQKLASKKESIQQNITKMKKYIQELTLQEKSVHASMEEKEKIISQKEQELNRYKRQTKKLEEKVNLHEKDITGLTSSTQQKTLLLKDYQKTNDVISQLSENLKDLETKYGNIIKQESL